ncbi:MAG: hypothetical protein EKK64_04835 [Neisseriaceae bacterium]|nr:MAG: hypothetical protein EKK64_04835 [Neisseriaceae bacterium]
MSGGTFGYEQFYVLNIAEKLEAMFFKNKKKEEFFYSEETRDEFIKAISTLKTAAVYAERIDYLLAEDDSEETFHKRLKEQLDALSVSLKGLK